MASASERNSLILGRSALVVLTFKIYLPHSLYGHRFEDVVAPTDAYTKTPLKKKKLKQNLREKNCLTRHRPIELLYQP